ncbi:MAG: TRAP transporter small permease subunit [Hydrogenophaga sp.]|jgi:TRAP-type mannitol/chloroaromatic compound transport system permease small subunit|uniref:TRAP transporter small permease subunit n=1 Tax=Hydrogenophaga sp. TaxID=1904254 RepID=UPI002579A8D5|nr:TRAP transporter small permease subunit [Hydrogenophaga sp.]MBL0944440.1 TRAP transporter small permease subunit [Hydrogenophaga sp.]
MQALLKLSALIDRINDLIGRAMMWFVLAATLISAGNAIVRKVAGTSSNAWLEVQWYLFAAVFMLGGGYAFLRNAHVRIDFLSSKFSARTRNWVDIVGIVVCLVPLCLMLIVEGWPVFARAWVSGEMSSNAGGLIRWPVYLLIPVGFAVLLAQGVSEIIKRAAFLSGAGPDVLAHKEPDETEVLLKELSAADAAAQNKA